MRLTAQQWAHEEFIHTPTGNKKEPYNGALFYYAETERFELSVPLRELHLSRVVH